MPCILPDLFELKLNITLTCDECHKNGSAQELSRHLIIPCSDSIQQSISRIFRAETLVGLQCECTEDPRDRVTKRRRTSIAQGPEILCIHINRFQSYQKYGRTKTTKNDKELSFSEVLDLSSYVYNKTPLRYRLLAAIHHKGKLEAGHYISVTRTPAGNWECQDNERVRKVSLGHATRSMGGFTPFLLFWEKMPTFPQTVQQALPIHTEALSNTRKRSHHSALRDEYGTDSRHLKAPKTLLDLPERNPKQSHCHS